MNTKDIKLDPAKLPWRQADREIVSPGVVVQENAVPDLLATVFEAQHRLMERYEGIERANGAITVPESMYGQLDDRFVQIRLKDLAYRVVEELSEATNCLKNKPWKNTFVTTDKEHFIEELSDAFHFFVEWCITAGLGPDDLFRIYFLKNAVNQFRQQSNY